MRSLIDELDVLTTTCAQRTKSEIADCTNNRDCFERNLNQLKALHHSQCIFNRQPPLVPGLQFRFDDAGALHGEFTCDESYQGYEKMVHGGVLAAIIDASMAQCLMGHKVVAYTAELSIKYRKPVLIQRPSALKTSIVGISVGLLYTLRSEIRQKSNLVVEATGKFFKVK